MIGIVLFKIGNLAIYTHGFFLVMGITLAGASMYFAAKRVGMKTEFLLEYIVYTVLFGIIGARITYYILYSSDFNSFLDLFKIWQGGLVSYGGFVAGVIAFVLVVRGSKEKIIPWLDILTISSLLGLAVGRLGSFLSGEIVGVPYSGAFSIQGLFPVTLAESIWDFAVFAFFIIAFISKRFRVEPGILALEALMLYALGRFVIEFFRNESTIALGLSLSQIVLVVIFIGSITIFIRQILLDKKGTGNAR